MARRNPSENNRDWIEIAESLLNEAESLPPGEAKHAAEIKAAKMKKAVEIRNWLTSPGLRICEGRISEEE
jgi:hypothetical protein